MRQTMNGNLLIEINGGPDPAKIVKVEVVRIFGPSAKIRMTNDCTAVEIRDLDEVTTKKEVLESVLALGDSHGPKIVCIRKAYGGAQTALCFSRYKLRRDSAGRPLLCSNKGHEAHQ